MTGMAGPFCPVHGTPLDGGTVQYWCRHGHGVMAADISHEFNPERIRL